MKSTALLLVFACILLATLAAPARSAVNVSRTGSENPMVEVFKSTIYGGLTGLAVGGAIAIADDHNDNDGDIIRWCFAGGTILGLGYGFYHVSSRPSGEAMIEIEHGRLALHPPDPVYLSVKSAVLEPSPGARLSLVSVRF